MWRRVTAIGLAASALLLGVTSPAKANDIREYTIAVPCASPDPSDTTGTVRVYLNYLQDYTPNPDKVRPLYFVIQNRFNHTMRVTGFTHFSRAGVQNWWFNDEPVLSIPNADGTHQAGNLNIPSNPFYTGQNGAGALPWRGTSSGQGSLNRVYRPQNSLALVGTYSPINNPWWTEARNDGPYFQLSYYVQGDWARCDIFYP